MNGIKIGIICNCEITRDAFVASLSTFQEERIEIVFEMGTLELFQTSIPHASNPDVLLLDVDIPDINGAEVIDMLLLSYPNCSIIIITGVEDKDILIRYINAGAKGCLKKDVSQNKLISVVSTIVNGGCYISPALTRVLFDYFQCARKQLSGLSYREQQIVNAILEGLSYKLVAHRYHISIDTVRFYVKRIYKRLSINSKGELLALTRLGSS